jgi:hypothetical protein
VVHRICRSVLSAIPGLRSAIISISNDATKPIYFVSGEVYNPNVTGPGEPDFRLAQVDQRGLSPGTNAVPLERFGING